jgi:predicted XRE-type DNA-binding protein
MDDLIKAAQAVLQASKPVEVQKARAQLAAALAAAQGAPLQRSLLAAVASDDVDLQILTIKSKLWSVVAKAITSKALTQRHAAELLGVTQPRVSNLMSGKLDKFSIDFFVGAASRVGFAFDLCHDQQNNEHQLLICVKNAELPGVYIDRAHALCCKEWQ